MTNILAPNAVLRLFREIGETTKQKSDLKGILQSSAATIGRHLGLDRCTVLWLKAELADPGLKTLAVIADYLAFDSAYLHEKCYQLSENSELYELLRQGKPLPLKDLVAGEQSGSRLDQLDSFIADSRSQSLVAFPLISQTRLVGCLSMHCCQRSEPFSEEVLELGETLAAVLTMATDRIKLDNELTTARKIFEEAAFPSIIVDRQTAKVLKANRACRQWLGHSKTILDQGVEQLFPEGHNILAAMRSLTAVKPTATVPDIASVAEGVPNHLDAELSLMDSNNDPEVLLILHPRVPISPAGGISSSEESGVKRAEEIANNLSKQLSWERWLRQMICKLHATLDRDALLQNVVDGFGRALGASRCLIVRTDGLVSPMVTHEYVEPDISPLGLGRTGQFPAAAISYFRQKVDAIPDISILAKSGELTADEYEYFAENGVRGMAAAPIASHGANYGVIVILERGPVRKWTQHELDVLEITANQTAVALGHSQSYLQLKDQLFNMNLLGNLTQQLTNTLELVSRSGKSEGQEEKAKSPGVAPPLSLRELEVLKLIASGLANREIAQRLFLTESTVELHASRIRKKLKLKSRTALVKFACDNGLA